VTSTLSTGSVLKSIRESLLAVPNRVAIAGQQMRHYRVSTSIHWTGSYQLYF